MCIFVPSNYAMITIKQIKIKGYFGKGHFKATATEGMKMLLEAFKEL